jgi:hypothetical protein
MCVTISATSRRSTCSLTDGLRSAIMSIPLLPPPSAVATTSSGVVLGRHAVRVPLNRRHARVAHTCLHGADRRGGAHRKRPERSAEAVPQRQHQQRGGVPARHASRDGSGIVAVVVA